MRAGTSRPTAHRIAQTLVAEGYLRQDVLSGRLSIGFSMLTLSASLLDKNRLRPEALPHLQTLARLTGERTNVGILHNNEVLYLAGVEKPSLPTIYTRFGKTAPAHCCSMGKAMIAYLSESKLRSLLAKRPMIAQTPNSITTMSRLMEELATTRLRGYAVDDHEHELNSACVAATIFDSQGRPVGAISISGRQLEPLLQHIPTLQHTAEVISHVL